MTTQKTLYSIITNEEKSACLYSFLTSEDLILLSQCNKAFSKAILSSNEIIHKQVKSGNKT